MWFTCLLVFLLNLFPCKQCWSLLKLQCVFAKKNFDHYYKALLKCYLLAFLFFANILSLQTCFVLLTNFCSIYPSQRSTISFTFVQGIPTSQNTKTMKKTKKKPIWSQVKEWFSIASIFFAIGKLCLSCLFVVIVSFAQTQDQNPSFWKLCG